MTRLWEDRLMNNDPYDIEAEAAEPSSTAQLEKMFQSLLADDSVFGSIVRPGNCPSAP